MQWIKHVQFEFLDTMSAKMLQNNDLISLELKIDNVLRCHGRFNNADIPEETQVPVCRRNLSTYLDNLEKVTGQNCWSKNFIKNYFMLNLHIHYLSQIQSCYWIRQGRTIVRNMIYHCGICRKNHGGPFKMLKMALWLTKKFSESMPSNYTGLDYLCPLYVKENP